MSSLPANDQDLRSKRLELEQQHRDLDAAIAALMAQNSVDQLQVQRLKKRKLGLKDQIAEVSDLLVPDIIA